MPYYDDNGKITIDEAAANADIRRLQTAITQLEKSKKAVISLQRQAAEGEGQTTAAVSEKCGELIGKINDMLNRLEETSAFIKKTVAHYQQVDADLKARIMSEEV